MGSEMAMGRRRTCVSNATRLQEKQISSSERVNRKTLFRWSTIFSLKHHFRVCQESNGERTEENRESSLSLGNIERTRLFTTYK